MTVKPDLNCNQDLKGLQRLIWDWASDSDGAATDATLVPVSGIVVKAIIVPDGGDTAPSAAYDMTVTDEEGIDLLEGNGADCSATAVEYISQSNGLGVAFGSKLTLNITNAGDSNGGKVYLFLA